MYTEFSEDVNKREKIDEEQRGAMDRALENTTANWERLRTDFFLIAQTGYGQRGIK